MKTLTVILEKGTDNDLFGRIEGEGFLLTTAGYSEKEITENLRDLLDDFLEHEGKNMTTWQDIKAQDVVFDYEYDLTAFFEIFSSVKINSIAEKAEINKSLMRQYATGIKHPSAQKAKKIETAIHQLGQSLLQIRIS